MRKETNMEKKKKKAGMDNPLKKPRDAPAKKKTASKQRLKFADEETAESVRDGDSVVKPGRRRDNARKKSRHDAKKKRLYFAQDVVTHSAVKRAGLTVADTVRRESAENEDENAAVEGVQRLEEGAKGVHRLRKRSIRLRRKNRTISSRAKELEQRISAEKRQKLMQKKRIKREYAKAKKAGQTSGSVTKGTIDYIKKIGGKVTNFFKENRKAYISVALLIALLLFIMSCVSSCSAVFLQNMASYAGTSYISADEEIRKAELYYTQLESELQQRINRTEEENPGYDDYRYNIGEIGHDPFILISYLSAKYEEFTFELVKDELDALFALQYQLDTEEADEETLNVTLTSNSLTAICQDRLDVFKKELFSAYNATKGNLQMFGSPVAFNWYGSVRSYYGYRIDASSGTAVMNNGIDISAPQGTQILAGLRGTVVESGQNSGYGNYVAIENASGYRLLYANLNSRSVSVGEAVEIGDEIGLSGSYVHVELVKNGVQMNPVFYLETGEGSVFGTNEYTSENAQKLLEEAAKYLGTPYVWGGYSPSGFDCSGFVSYCLTNSGVRNTGRLTAQGLYDSCTPVSESEVQPGDLIFFTGTYDAGVPVTHVGIYVGNGQMIHCGHPVQYSSIYTSYWQSHFYSFGRW
jgi:murein DD-endopeptidase MepM/ murein hydrolase activator NlpD